jgi:hypothetical protein
MQGKPNAGFQHLLGIDAKRGRFVTRVVYLKATAGVFKAVNLS